MLLKLISGAFGKRTSPVVSPGPSAYAGPRHDKFVAFIVDVEAAHFLAPGDRITAGQASLRLRAWLPARELMRLAPVCLVPIHQLERDPQLTALGEVHAIVVGKFSVQRITAEPARFAALAGWVGTMATKHRAIADFCDDLAAASDMYASSAPAELQLRLLDACPAVASTAALRERLLPHAKHGVTVIEDPYERDAADVSRFSPQAQIQMAWFGTFGPPLLPFLYTQFSEIANRLSPRAIELAFITHPSQQSLAQELGERLRALHDGFRLRFVPWSREAVAMELACADLVLLPQDAASEWGRVKSHNRLVETLRAGRFAVASAIPSYLEMSEHAWIGDDLADGVEWALAHPSQVLARIRSGQNYVATRFAPDRIGGLWATALQLTPASGKTS